LAPKGCTPAQPEPTPQRIFSTESSLDCDYLHTVSALQCAFNDVIAAHQKILNHRNCRCVSDVLNETDDRECGYEIGIVEVLHTRGAAIADDVAIESREVATGCSLGRKSQDCRTMGMKVATRRQE